MGSPEIINLKMNNSFYFNEITEKIDLKYKIPYYIDTGLKSDEDVNVNNNNTTFTVKGAVFINDVFTIFPVGSNIYLSNGQYVGNVIASNSTQVTLDKIRIEIK